MKVLVTGAGGYIGSGLVKTLDGRGWEVHGVVREPLPAPPVEHTVADLVDDVEALDAACAGVDTVVHLAGENEVVAAGDPVSALAGTIVATERVVEAAARAKVRRLVYVSTVHVYGARMEEGALLTEDLRLEPRSTYAISRLASEHVASTLSAEGVDVVVLRLTNAVGAPTDPTVDRWTLVANDLCRQGAVDGRLVLRSSGVQYRDFVPLSDVRSILAAASTADEPVLPPGTYNLGSGVPTTVRSLAELVQDSFERLTGGRPQLQAPEAGASRPQPYHVSVERAARHGLRSETPLEEAIEETARFCMEHREVLAREEES